MTSKPTTEMSKYKYSLASWPLSWFTAVLCRKHHNHHHCMLFYSCLSWAAFLTAKLHDLWVWEKRRFTCKVLGMLCIWKYLWFLSLLWEPQISLCHHCHHDHHHSHCHHYHPNHIHHYVSLVDTCDHNISNREVTQTGAEGSQVQWEFIFSLY